jgi:hypothetical protein
MRWRVTPVHIRGPPVGSLDGRLCQGLKTVLKTKADGNPTREAGSTLCRFLTGHSFIGEYAQRFHAVRVSSAALTHRRSITQCFIAIATLSRAQFIAL